MNSLDRLKERLHGKTAEEAVDALYSRGAIDHHLARKFIISEEFDDRYCNSGDSARKVQEDLAIEHGVTRQCVSKYVSGN